jgi:MFS family permease
MDTRQYRAGMLCGIAFPILIFVGTSLIFSHTPDTSNTTGTKLSQAWLQTISDKGDRAAIIIGCFVLLVAALAFIWFATVMRDRFAKPGSPMFGFALLAAVGVAVAALGPLAVAGGHDFGGEPLPADGTAIWFVTDLMFPSLLAVFGLAVAAFIGSLLLSSRGALPMWLVVFGWLAVVGGILGVLFLPILIVLLWFVASGIHGLVSRPADESPAAT